ncbi:sulfate/molybdate ABC transporter ATP-binding protein (plasmid) [Sinorhizobium medicae]|uniref:sulfate/molybdate ABC transporter ATP-binding protein n=1 Tax=Sinorhizobium medicae TaxID=110321 RepID=UPI000380C7A7|nr:sulfate/molybdate ABC transporter ATP-binding protein [Sinorhizobium medicae]MQX49182.1 sulfate ABC transporter ATP-binding protein [Sinorhizobium medicae]WQO49329.1 sulfate/molybdate ABC transporter ATP-binding protein [Sinorhizobium medicae]WQO69399.1 sulfate/molybdate ABC transporter ATP-binding protein [Sinorhizobium medicae]WQO76532.1 sulfate/molybdate ABC transporter ATP-binding protein [Sinorhizobium medicae]WQO95703.1 sulfate/molybdate ABC transporter ATP-binding protein [Sinorhizob
MEVRVQNIRKEFARFPALDNVSLDIRSGELIALLGPSGSGKTTLLRLVAGLESPTGGTIFFGDDDASKKTVQERNIGFVFQHYALFRHMTVLDNVAFGLKVRTAKRRPPAAEIRRRALDLLDLVQLSGLEKRYPAQLSGGQRQRVALARAMAVEPNVLLLDEPFGALDAQVRKELRRWLREIHDRTGHTTIFVTHDQEEALELADRVVVMSKGTIEQVGSPDEIYDHPVSPFVYGFIGQSNCLDVTLANGEIWLEDRPIGLRAANEPDGPATLYFRPHDIELIDGCGGCLAGLVTASRRVAGTRHLELELGRTHPRVEIELPPERAAFADHTRIAFRPTRWKLFQKGERRITAREEVVVPELEATGT